jgi:WD40 repeat protein
VASLTQKEWPDPILDLERVIGFSSGATETLLWLIDGSAFLYASYSTIIIRYVDDRGAARQLMDVSDGSLNPNDDGDTSLRNDSARNQEFLLGHSGSISAMTLTEDGSLLASAEAKIGSNPCSIRVWNLPLRECLVVVKAHAREVHSVCFSSETTQRQRLLLCGVGFDDNGRTQILVWDCSELRRSASSAGKTPYSSRRVAVVMIARQTSDFPVNSIAFSPYEHEFPCLVSCGRENIRYWRVARSGHIVGHPVILKEYSRGTVFNELGFDPLCESFPSDMRRLRPVYAASSVGTLLVVDYDTREVVCVYQLHDASINCLVVNEGFCVTGSDDQILRVWPLDFTDFFLEAQHDAAVTAVDVSSDGMKVLVGSHNSAVGVLDISNQVYKTVLRSHAQPIVASALLPWCTSSIDQAIGRLKDELMTGSADGTLRIWDARSGDQLYEFDVKHDQVTCIEPAPVDQGIVAVGFASGCCRIFDVRQLTGGEEETGTTEGVHIVVAEIQQHKSAIVHLKFTTDGKSLYSSGEGKQLCLYNVTAQREFIPVKMLLVDFNTESGRLSVSQDNNYLAVITGDSRGVLLLQCDSLRLYCTVTPPKPASSAVSATELKLAEFCMDQLLLLSKSDRLHIYAMGSRQFVRSMPLLGQDGGVTAIATSVNLKYMATGGTDGSLRVWQMDASGKVERLFQSFMGQTGAVTQLAFASGGKRLLATSESSTAFVWQFLGDCTTSPLHHLSSLLVPLGSAASHTVSDDEKENNARLLDVSNQEEESAGRAEKEALSGKKRANDIKPSTDVRPEEAMSPSLDIPIPSLKPRLHLALAKDSLVFDSEPSEASVARTTDGDEIQGQASVVATSVLEVTMNQCVALRLVNVIEGFSSSHVAWSPTLGKLLFVMGSTLWIENLATAAMDVREEDAIAITSSSPSDSPLESQQKIVLLEISPSCTQAATVSSSYDYISIHCLHHHIEADPRAESSCHCGKHAAQKVLLIPDTDSVHAVAFSSGPETGEKLVCFSSTVNGASQYFVSVASLSLGITLWSQETTELPSPVDTILPLMSHDRFLLFSPDDSGDPSGRTMSSSRLQVVDVVFTNGKFCGVRLHTLVERFPLDVQCVAVSQDTTQDDARYQRYLVGIAKDGFCCFFDLEESIFIATTQLLPASSQMLRDDDKKRKLSSIDVIKWSGSKTKQSLLVTASLQEAFVCVHALPMKSTKFSARAQIDWQRVARGGVSLTHAISLQGGALRSLSIDPRRGVGVVTTSDATVSIVDLDAPAAGGSTKVLRCVEYAPKLPSRPHSFGGGRPSLGMMGVEDIGWAVQDSLLLSRSAACGSIRAWLPDTPREVLRFDVASAQATACCSCFAVHSCLPLVMSSYDDNTLRIFDVVTGQVVANFQLALDRHSASSHADRAEQVRALRTLRQRERLRSPSPAKMLARSSSGNHRASPQLTQLAFVGQSSTALAVTSDHRLFWIDYSSAISKPDGLPGADRRAARASKTPVQSSKVATSEVVYQEIALSESKAQRPGRRPVSIAIESISVHNNAAGEADAAGATARKAHGRTSGAKVAFLVVLRVVDADGRTSHAIKVYADPNMRMLSEDLLLPSDEWRVDAGSMQAPVALFLPATDASTRVLYTSAFRSSEQADTGDHHRNMDGQPNGWCLEIRDCQERAVRRRLIIGTPSFFLGAPVCMVVLPCAIKRRIASEEAELVLIVNADGRMALVDLKRHAILPIDTHVARTLKLQMLSPQAIGATHGKLVLCSSRGVGAAQDGAQGGRVVIGELAVATA